MTDRKILNRAMAAKIASGQCLDVSKFRQPDQRTYALPEGFFREGIDYADTQFERWIWSVGKDKATGAIMAATDGRFYQNRGFECLWLR